MATATVQEHTTQTPRYSVVVPVRDEAPNIEPLVAEIAVAFKGRQYFEVVFVDDGSHDATADKIRQAMSRFPWVRGIRHDRSCGKSAAERTGILNARAAIIVTIDGDGQNDPADIPRLLDAIDARDRNSPIAMVAGQRARREDNLVRRLSSSVANKMRRAVLKDGSRDVGCGLKAFDRVAYLSLPYFDNIHRFYPALMDREGYGVIFVDVGHRRRRAGLSKYGVFNRLGVGILDLAGTAWLMRRRRLPKISEL